MNGELIEVAHRSGRNPRDLMWVPLKGKETEVWAARSPDGKRLYNVRRETGMIIDTWTALWAYKYDKIPNVVATKFLARWEAQSVLDDIESRFEVDPREVKEENKRLAALTTDGWCFQGVFDGMSIWTFRPFDNSNTTFVIINDIIRRPDQYSVSRRWFTEGKHKGQAKLKMESLGIHDSLEHAKRAIMRITGN